MKSQIHDKVAIQLPLVFLKESYRICTYESLAPFKFNLQTSLCTNSSRIGKLIAKVIAVLMLYCKSVHNTGLLTRAGYMVINCLFTELINAHKTSVTFFIGSRAVFKTNEAQWKYHFKLLLLLVALKP